jgi:hypothetical protein
VIIILLLTTVNLITLFTERTESAEIYHFVDSAGDFDEKIIGMGVGGWHYMGNLSIGKGIELYDASFNITGLPDKNGEYPRYFSIYVNQYSNPTTAFQWWGQGYGSLGHQWLFSNELSTRNYDFQSSGSDESIVFRLPREAAVTSASMEIEGTPNIWAEKNTVDNDENNIGEVHAADINGDGVQDLVSAGSDKVVWYNNTNGNASQWDEIEISSSHASALLVFAFDVDNDNDTDVVAASRSGVPATGHIKYYRNMDGKGLSWQAHDVTLSTEPIYECFNIAIADMDNDGDGDIVATSRNFTAPMGPYWFNNTDGNGTSWEKNEIVSNYMRSYGLEIMDVDNDGDNDTVVTNSWNRQVHWFENRDGNATSWSNAYTISNFVAGYTYNMASGDIDCDGDTDIAVACSDGIRWFSRPINPKGLWSENYIQGLSSWTHADIAVGDFGNDEMPPDGKPDIVAVSYVNFNYVLLYMNKCSTSVNDWEFFLINPSHVDAYTVKTADVDGDNYPEMIVGANSISTNEDILIYKINLSNPSNLILDIGADGTDEWTHSSGWFNTTVTLDNLANTINGLIATKSIETDQFGVDWVLIELNLSTGSGGRITFSDLDIKYDCSVTVKGQESIPLEDMLNQFNSDTGIGNNSIPLYIYPQVGTGRLKIDDIKIIYNGPPKPLPVEEYYTFEDTKNDRLINLSKYFQDDYISSTELNYEVISFSNDHYVDVFINKAEPYYLGIDAESGSDNNDWTGTIAVIVKAIDDDDLETLSEVILINVLPVNDEPIVGNKKLPDININEGGISSGLDLDADDYFEDVDSSTFYFNAVLDPLKEHKIPGKQYGTHLNIILNNNTRVLSVEALGDWYTKPDESVRLRIYCDDDPDDINYSKAYQDIFITVNNLDDDAPSWSQIPDIIIKEDEPRNDAVDLLAYVNDIDNDKSDLKFFIESISDNRVLLNIDDQLNLDVSSARDFFGTATASIMATDGTNYGSTTFKITVENVNDPPETQLISPLHDVTIFTPVVKLRWTGTDVDPGDENNLTYTIYLDTGSGTQSIASGIKGNSYNVTDLADKTTFFWKVIPSDGSINGICVSQPLPHRFSVDLGKKPHSVLTSPEDGIVSNRHALELKWTGYSEDNDELTYDVYVSTELLNEPYPETYLLAEGISETGWDLVNLEPGVTYYWTVIPSSIKSVGVCDSGIWSFKYDPTVIPYKLNIEAPEELKFKKGEFYLEEILIRNDGVNPDIARPTISAGVIQYQIGLEGAGTRHSIGPGETRAFVLNISAEKIPAGTYYININAESIGSGEVESANVTLTIYKDEEKEASSRDSLMAVSFGFISIIILMIILFFIFLRFRRIKDDKRRVDAELLKPTLSEEGILDAKDVEYMYRADLPEESFTAEPVTDPLKSPPRRYPMLPPSQDEIDRFLKDMLDQLDAKFIVGDMSEETYRELKGKYEKRLKPTVDAGSDEDVKADERVVTFDGEGDQEFHDDNIVYFDDGAGEREKDIADMKSKKKKKKKKIKKHKDSGEKE